MRALATWSLPLVLAALPTAQEQTGAPAPRPAAEALAELARVSDAGEHGRAAGLARELLERVSVQAVEAADDRAGQARAQYGAALALLRAGRDLELADLPAPASGEEPGEDEPDLWTQVHATFRSAAALAGPGELRLDALYNAGLARLVEAEQVRARIPELAGDGPTPIAPPAGPGAAGGASPEGPDPLPLARRAYERARAALVDRLRADVADGDTRANLELVQRRLRELDELERQREQQEDESQQGEDDSQQQQPDQQPGDQGQPQQDQDPQQQPPENQGDQEQQEAQPQEPQEPQEPEEQQPEEQQQREGPEPQQGDEQQEQPAGESPASPDTEERLLTREEVQRLLDRLEEIEEQARELEAALRRTNKVKVEKDW